MDQCPLEGRCVECGLPFRWVDIFDPDLFGPRWCVEYVSRRRLPRSVVSTWVRSLWPWTFFRALKMTHVIELRRLVLFVLSLAAVGYLVVCLGQARLAYWNWQGATKPAWALATTVSAPRAVGQALLTPFSRKSLGTVTYAAGGARTRTDSYPPPWDTAECWSGLAYIAPMGLLMAVLQPLGFLAMPISVRRARVRPAHLARIMVYSLSWLLLVVVVHGLAVGLLGGRAVTLAERLMLLHLLFLPGFLMTWHGAVRCYLRMDQPLTVALAVTLMAGLATAIVLVQIYMIQTGGSLYG
jgi:hypothetical protein